MVSTNDVTILVSSCDAYEDAWEPFFRLWKTFWPCCPYKAVLCTENKQYKCDFMDVETVNTGDGISWTAKMRCALNKIDSEYVLFSLEDFFLLEKVDVEIFNKALTLMDKNSDIGVINFNMKRMSAVFPEQNDMSKCFREKKKNDSKRTNIMISLWRKDSFLKLLFEDEDPWTYEKEAKIRSLYFGFKIYAQDYNYTKPAFHYCMSPVDGFGITQKKWLKNNRPFFESQGISGVNYSNLGEFHETVSYESIENGYREDSLRRKKEQETYIKNLKGKAKIKEILYRVRKKIKNCLRKTSLFKKIVVCKKKFYYMCYYRKLNKQ